MIAQRVVRAVVALGAMAASAGVVIVAAAFAIFSLLREYLGPSGAAAIIVATFAIIFAALAVVLLRTKSSGKTVVVADDQSFPERMLGIIRHRPVIGAAAAVAAGLLAWRNPALVSVILRVFEPRASVRDRV